MPLEDFKRPNHPDFKTGSELRDMSWSGIRENRITDEREVWVEGRCVMTMSRILCNAHPDLWNTKYADVFSLNVVDTKE
jgi:hypothetical protein